jgi:hypothetical protein
VRVSEVPVTNASLNKGDVFILDLGLKIFVFCGPTSNKVWAHELVIVYSCCYVGPF